jgi:hypothetical protein
VKKTSVSRDGPERSALGLLLYALATFAVKIFPSWTVSWRQKRLLAIRERIERELSSLAECSLKVDIRSHLGKPSLVLTFDCKTQHDAPKDGSPVSGFAISDVEQADRLEVYDRDGFRFHFTFRGDEKVSCTLEYVLSIWDQAIIRHHGTGRARWWPYDVLPRLGCAPGPPPDTDEHASTRD